MIVEGRNYEDAKRKALRVFHEYVKKYPIIVGGRVSRIEDDAIYNSDQFVCFGRKIKVDPSKVEKVPLPIGFRLKIYISPEIIGSYFLIIGDMDPYGIPNYLYVSEFWKEEDFVVFKRMWEKIRKTKRRIVAQLIDDLRLFWKIRDYDNNMIKVYETLGKEVEDGEKFLEKFLKETENK